MFLHFVWDESGRVVWQVYLPTDGGQLVSRRDIVDIKIKPGGKFAPFTNSSFKLKWHAQKQAGNDLIQV